MRWYDRSIDRWTRLKAFTQDNQSFKTRTHTYKRSYDDEWQRKSFSWTMCTKAIINSSVCTHTHKCVLLLKCIHHFVNFYACVCVCAASCIVVVSKIKRLVVCTRVDAREIYIYSNVDAWGCA